MTEKTFNIPVESFRKIPNPYKEGPSSVSQMYTAICDVKDLPEDLINWMETNPRKQNTNSGVAKKIRASLVEGKDFHLLNRGILLSANDVTFNNYDGTMKLVFTDKEYHGNVDGGHTLMVILENRDDLERGQQFVKLEILTGVEGIFEDLAAARNTSTQVQDKSIANLRDYFDIIKQAISTEPFKDRVYFMENDDGNIDVGDILAILNMFNLDTYPGMDSCPVVSFSSKKRCIDNYIHVKCVSDLTNQIERLKSELAGKETALQELQERTKELKKALDHSRKALEAELKKQSVSALSDRMLLLVEELQEQQYKKLIADVEYDLNRKFRELIRKDDFVDRIYLGNDFSLHLVRNQAVEVSALKITAKRHGAAALKGSLKQVGFQSLITQLNTTEESLGFALADFAEETITLPVELDYTRFSNGEKQVLVMSLYWAIMNQSHNKLPFIIDTPFARIDTEHRANITEKFFKELQGQLFVLSTNEEIRHEHMVSLEQQIAKVYMLEYGEDKRTRISEGSYFEVK